MDYRKISRIKLLEKVKQGDVKKDILRNAFVIRG